ncbi:MAG TPA: TolC family protein [Candidatus Sulfotelmatobacter sp.]|nr:TolC family protein [Candidatus Sulfotelmatobacter sp.]
MKVLAVLVVAIWSALAASAQNAERPVTEPGALARTEAILSDPQEHHHPSTIPLTLPELESASLAKNPEILAAMRRIAVAEARRGSAGSLDDPAFMYRGWGTPLSRPWDLNQSQHMFMYSQSLPGGGKRQLRTQVADTDVDIARAEAEAKKRDVVAQVRRAFYELLQNQDGLRFHDEQASLARQSLESARIKYVVGKVPQSDMLKAQIALTRLVEHLVMLQQDGDLARSRLNTLLGRDPSSPLDVVGDYSPPSQLPGFLDLEKLALDNRPELAAVSATIRQSETRTQLAEKSLVPDYTLSGGYMLMPGDSRYRNTYAAEVTVTLPWLNRGRHNAEIAEASAVVAAEKAEYESRRAEIFAEIQESLVRARVAQRLVGLYRDTLRPQAQAVLKATVAAYQVDRTDYLNLLDSQNTALDVELDYIRAVSELETRMADLEHAVGTPLPRILRTDFPDLTEHKTADVTVRPEVKQ